MLKLLNFFNENHWYIIGGIIVTGLMVWLYGCQSKVASIIDPTKKVTRDELQLESDYLIGQLKVKMTDLDKQDKLKALLLEQAAIFGQTGQFNPTGLMNACISIGAIAFGLDRNRKYKIEKSTKNNT